MESGSTIKVSHGAADWRRCCKVNLQEILPVMLFSCPITSSNVHSWRSMHSQLTNGMCCSHAGVHRLGCPEICRGSLCRSQVSAGRQPVDGGSSTPSHANWGTSGASSAAPSEPCTVHKACKWPADAMRWLEEALATRSQRHFKRQLSSSPKSHIQGLSFAQMQNTRQEGSGCPLKLSKC